ncbi:L7Ae/L30e/S12e/Gadd45 family ribosomal protein [Syntrophomonas erecta]
MHKIYNIIGLAHKAGKISSGTLAAKTSLQRKRACLLVITDDISSKTRDSLVSTCERQQIAWVSLGDKYALGTAVGKAYRVAVTINDEGLAKTVLKHLGETGEDRKSTGVVQWPK